MTLLSQSRDTGEASAPGSVKLAALRWQWHAHAAEWIKWVRAPGRPDSYFRFHGEQFLSMVPAPGRLTLDVGCGEGRVGRDLREMGHKVLGVDCSLAMCDAAATHQDFRDHPQGARVIAGDAATLPLADGSVDCAIAFMCLQDMDDMPGALREIARVLEDGKQLVLAIVHPMYSHGRLSGTDGNGDGGARDYFQPEQRVSTDQQDDLTVTFYREHRPLETYMTALLDAGFAIEKWDEVTEPDKTRPNHSVPMFLDIVATKKPSVVRHRADGRLRRHPAGGRPDSIRPGMRRSTISIRIMTRVPRSMADLRLKLGAPILLLGGALGGVLVAELLAYLRP